VIGQPVGVSLPRLNGVRLRYCSRSDEQPAAILAKSMLRLGISRVSDWSGSAVDFVARGLARYCRLNGGDTVSRVFSELYLRFLDDLMERTEYERCQAEGTGPSSRFFVHVNYDQAAMVQIGPALAVLNSLDKDLPSAFFVVLTHNLERWMTVYDFRSAVRYAEDQIHLLEDEELKESFYPEVKNARPGCLKRLPKYGSAVRLLRERLPAIETSRASQLVKHCLSMHEQGAQYEHAWPYLLRNEVPEIEDYLEDTDEPGPGALIVFDEEDLIEACFNEEMQYLGQDHCIGASLMMTIDLSRDSKSLDARVKACFEYLGAMVRSLAAASALIEMIRGIYDEDVRQRGIKQGLPAQPSPADLRGE
jgi:hypothetical protein